jgi:hypothetical protein
MQRILRCGTLAMLLIGLVCNYGLAAEKAMITGEVTEDGQLMDANGAIYDIADTAKGRQLLDNVGKVVEIRGTVTGELGMKEITVESFRVVIP